MTNPKDTSLEVNVATNSIMSRQSQFGFKGKALVESVKPGKIKNFQKWQNDYNNNNNNNNNNKFPEWFRET